MSSIAADTTNAARTADTLSTTSTSEAPESEECVFAVENMFCGGCAATVERAVRRLPGVTDVSVSFLGDTAIVQYQPEVIEVSAIRQSIERLGYATQPVGEGAQPSRATHFERQLRIRLGVAVGFGLWVMMASMVRLFIELPSASFAWYLAVFSGVLSIPVLSFSAAPFLKLGWLGLRERVPGMDSLIFVATIAAVSGSLITLYNGGSHVWFDVPVMLVTFQLLARIADFGAHRKASSAIRSLLDLSPVQARRIINAQASELVPLRKLCEGDVIQSHAGERLCMDGVIVRGGASIDTALLNGESVPEYRQTGDEVFAGTLNVDGIVDVRISTTLGSRRMDVLASSVGRLLNKKTNLMKLSDQIAFWLVPLLIVISSAVMLVLIVSGVSFNLALERALAVLVVSCPCALSLAVPLVVSVTATNAARQGILFRDASVLEKARMVDTVLIDKTGTLTVGNPCVVKVHANVEYAADDVISLAAQAGHASRHPLMVAIVASASLNEQDATFAKVLADYREHAGRGVESVLMGGSTVLAGSRQWLIARGVTCIGSLDNPDAQVRCSSEVCVAIDGHWAGSIYLADALRPDASELVTTLKQLGMKITLVSGDRPDSVQAVASSLGIEWRASASPEDKAAMVGELNEQERVVAFVGDGLNDGPALAAAAVGIATGKASDLARSAAAMAVLDGGLDRIVIALRIAARASAVLRSNLVWALLYNSLLLPAAVLGFVHPVMAVVAMGLSTLSVSLNSLRAGSAQKRVVHSQ